MTKMAETKITINASGSQVSHSNPSVQPLAVSAGVPVTAALKAAGNPNGAAHGQVPGAGVSILIHNPA